MACSRHARCTRCTEKCGFYFLTMENMTTICLEDPGTLGVAAIGMQSNYRMCYLVDPSEPRSTTTTMVPTTNLTARTTAQPVIAVASFIPILIGCIGAIGFFVACGGMIWCWIKKRKVRYELMGMRNMANPARKKRGRKVQLRQDVENSPYDEIGLVNLAHASQLPPAPPLLRSASNVTPYDIPNTPVPVRNESNQIRAVSHITTVWDTDGNAKSAETRF